MQVTGMYFFKVGSYLLGTSLVSYIVLILIPSERLIALLFGSLITYLILEIKKNGLVEQFR